ncbi:ferredoxin--NADP reductase [Kordiimonas pumila]|uniref:ferredoxin--NADP(+) reductase n=1 Tax=Kordiimonas pumila TaxID=2161677 RepID=A0ABV7D8U4_9PROT|nr:ferredoxin--NADP reductase [Kordiimonas pumila]
MNMNVDVSAKQASPTGPTLETVLSVEHWTDRLFSFRITRPSGFRFRSGEFVMIGLEADSGKPLMRAYSIASPNWDEELEFFSIKVPDGPLTSRLQKIQPGDKILLNRKSVGTLVHDALTPGKSLFLFSTGTGFAPFASVIRDPETYDKFERIIVTHTCRDTAELDYSRKIVNEVLEHEFLGEIAKNRLSYYESTTREDYYRQGRITTLIENGDFAKTIGLDVFNPETDRGMICGSNQMISDVRDILLQNGLTEGSNARPAEFVVEKAFVG